ncbi:hypothetical protein DIE14_19435 [Burkholderia sp. Bp9017]|nr:hypothetical protein DIE14_19435 [Burkholderia sp. Bp9017]RQZ32837.1 hypothetical protein DIE13_19345 [Burkholderia sp. Bp9016]
MWCWGAGHQRARAGPECGHVDTTRNRAAPEVELALIAVDSRGGGRQCRVTTRPSGSERSLEQSSRHVRNTLENTLLNQVVFPIRAVIFL